MSLGSLILLLRHPNCQHGSQALMSINQSAGKGFANIRFALGQMIKTAGGWLCSGKMQANVILNAFIAAKKGSSLNFEGQRIILRSESRAYVFVANGIGITPIRAMTEQAETLRSDYEMMHLGTDRDNMASIDEFATNIGARVWTKSKQGPCDPGQLFFGRDFTGSLIHSCGPEGLHSR